ncbi:DUF2723 domain-containing protein [candidate division KSB1 bacterium]|nr:DUF2723 domain-containing protein [candidate division KSB1 bacterium]
MSRLKEPKSIIGALVFLIALVTYLKTLAPTTSFWDCGEFIATSYIMGVPHPPGSPLFILVGRLFSMVPFVTDIGLRVNMISPILSAFAAMFTYLIIVRLIEMWQGKAQNSEQQLIHYASGVIGALAFTFSDSQWFNSVEAEVYAASLFFTAIVVWMILVWTEQSEDPHSDRWILLIFYVIGLAIGVHLLNVLALLTVFMIIYFQRKEITLESLLMFGGFSALSFITIYPGIVKGIPFLLNKVGFLPVFAAPVLLIIAIYYTLKDRKRIISLVLMSLLLVIVGYSTYSAIFIRSTLNPEIDENAPDTTEKFVKYLNREQYGDWSIFDRKSSLERSPNSYLYTSNPRTATSSEVNKFLWEYQIKKMFIRYFGWQYIGKGEALGPDGLIADTVSFRGLLGLPFLLGLIGLLHHFWRDWRRASAIMVLFIMTGIAIVIYLNQIDPQPRERDYAYTGAFFAFALWIGIGVSSLLESVRDLLQMDASKRKNILGLISLILLFAIPVNMFAFNYFEHSRSGNYVAWDYSKNILESCDKDAIVFTNGDNDTFPLWYLQTVEGIRRDIRVVNLSLLNTGWYIKQLRDEDPKVAVALTDKTLEQISPIPWKEKKTVGVKVPEEVLAKWKKPEDITDDDREMRFDVEPTLMGQGIRVQDIMIMHILSENKFKRPVYFAVTVSPENKVGLDKYLRMDGLAFRVLPVKKTSAGIDPDVLADRIFDKFSYRNLDNPNIYYNDNIKALLGNYRSAFLRLAQHQLEQKDIEKALSTLDFMEAKIPEDIIPTTDFRYSLMIGQMFQAAGRPEELKRRLDKVAWDKNTPVNERARFIFLYSQQLKDYESAVKLAKDIAEKNPEMRQAYYSYLIDLLRQAGQTEYSNELLTEWLTFDATNPTANMLKQKMQTPAKTDTVSDSDQMQ